ncbi:MAG TPA: ABC transporter permease [Gemmatimonadales bacterium]|nr:ABC transporter permease [Gemmatimonadales bacterium]
MISLNDLRFALRSLARVPGFALAVILTLGLGIGANTAIFSVVRGALLRPLPNRDGDRLVYLRQSAQQLKQANVGFSVPEVADYRSAAQTLQGFGEYSEIPATLVVADEPVRVTAGVVTGNYFDVMGLAPAAGRLFDSRDDGPAAVPAMVLTQSYWLQRFGGANDVVGKVVRFLGKPVTIVGVVQDAPKYPGRTDVFVNLVCSAHHLDATMATERTHRMTEVFARLAPGVTVEQAGEEIRRISTNVYGDHPETYEKAAGYAIEVRPLHEVLNERATLTFWLLMGAAAFVFVIACANVANLALIRGIRRERELVVRSALGAGAANLRRLLLAENLILALTGGVLGLIIAYAGLGLLVSFADQLTTRGGEIRLDGTVLGFTFVVAILVSIVLAYVPNIGTEGSLATALVSAGRRTTAGRGRQRMQRGLVVVQVAVSVILLTGAGLLVRTLMKLQAVETGVRVERVLTMEVPTDGSARSRTDLLTLYAEMRNRIAALPGVVEAGLGSTVPLRAVEIRLDIKAEGRAPVPGEPTPQAEWRTASPEYFRAAGIPLLKGREFVSTDRDSSGLVVILNQTLATRLFGDRDPIGQRVAWTGEVLRYIDVSGDWRTVVGVVGDTRDSGLDTEPAPVMFQPFAQEQVFFGAFVIRTAADPVLLSAAAVRAIHSLDPQALVEKVQTLEQVRDDRVAPRRVNALLVTSFGALALLIAAVGIAGVLAFSVSSRIGEIGIRMSLGADAFRVMRMILVEGWALLLGGLLLGVVGAFFATRMLAALLYGVSPSDPTTVGLVALLIAAVGTLACWLPAARAARVPPAVALQAE